MRQRQDHLTKPAELGKADYVLLLYVPSTSGTAAQTESTAMITDIRRGTKGCVWHPAQKPYAALPDPKRTVSLCRNLTAWTGCDALIHAIEAYCVPSVHPMCDGIALQALGMIYRALSRAPDAPGQFPVRGATLTGSCLAGVAFLTGLGTVHAISHKVGAEFDTQNGLTNAVVLSEVQRNCNRVEGCADVSGDGLGRHRFRDILRSSLLPLGPMRHPPPACRNRRDSGPA